MDYKPNEVGLFPTPTTPDEVGARMLMQERLETETDQPQTTQPSQQKAKPSDATRQGKEEAVNEVEMELSDKEDEVMFCKHYKIKSSILQGVVFSHCI